MKVLAQVGNRNVAERVATEGGRGRKEHLPADMRLDRELRMEQGMEKRIGLLEVVECCLAGFVQGQAQIWRDVVDRVAVRREDSGRSMWFFPTRQTDCKRVGGYTRGTMERRKYIV